jgi:hypothetical protein
VHYYIYRCLYRLEEQLQYWLDSSSFWRMIVIFLHPDPLQPIHFPTLKPFPYIQFHSLKEFQGMISMDKDQLLDLRKIK